MATVKTRKSISKIHAKSAGKVADMKFRSVKINLKKNSKSVYKANRVSAYTLLVP